MEDRRRVCVIGAGMGGLVTTKCMLDAGFDVTCFERDGYVGGRWHQENRNPIPRTTLTNLPKFMSCFSDFPMPDEFPLYLPADKFAQYFELYAQNFGLHAHIKFKHEVTKAEPLVGAKTDDETRNILQNFHWRITYKDDNSMIQSEEFDYLVVSSGFYSVPYIPQHFESVLKNFSGKVIHSIDYVDANEFKDQNVLVCGLGDTGGDISVEVSKVTQRAVVSTSHGTYIMCRLSTNGRIPIDAFSLRVRQYLPSFLIKILTRAYVQNISNHVCDLSKLRLVPKDVSSIILNDELALKISAGKVEVKPSIEKIDGKNVYFSNGTRIENVDTIILCTGYARKFSFLDDSVISIQRNGKQIPLYKRMFAANKYKHNVAFVNMNFVKGSAASTSEMQARYVAEVFKGNIDLPDTQTMEKKIDEVAGALESVFSDGLKEYNVVADVWKYHDELAGEIACRPSLWWILLTDPVLYWHLFNSYSCHEYRLIGPNKWNGARNAILNRETSKYAFMNGSRENSV